VPTVRAFFLIKQRHFFNQSAIDFQSRGTGPIFFFIKKWQICLELKLLLPDLLRIILLESPDELYQILSRGIALVLPAQQKNGPID
jgi:hypothetical protein